MFSPFLNILINEISNPGSCPCKYFKKTLFLYFKFEGHLRTEWLTIKIYIENTYFFKLLKELSRISIPLVLKIQSGIWFPKLKVREMIS